MRMLRYILEEILVVEGAETNRSLEFCIGRYKDLAQPTTEDIMRFKSLSRQEQREATSKKIHLFSWIMRTRKITIHTRSSNHYL